ncbi:unnamed protein product [Pseudo-nitzschia multistriata]|uniref:rRNA maturation factor n=1 Tax=Pseudo-nitzschia multistriata TaxID=183589 RepID=A0A448ZRN4_9STRA|nr:unnamed protein product [Pseudo-nitzschia multistriata]
MNISSHNRRRRSSLHQYHSLRDSRRIYLALAFLIALVGLNNMCQSFRSLRLLNRGMILKSDLLGRQIFDEAMSGQQIKSRLLASTGACSMRSYAMTPTRLFGSKKGVPGNPLGTVSIYNDQEALKEIDEDALQRTVHRISKIIGYETYDVTLLLVDDDEMRETNLETRGINSPTDILSFPFHSREDNKAGLLKEPEFDIPDYYTLGDMVVCVPYVIRRCKEDILFRKEQAEGATNDEKKSEYGDDDSDLIDDDDRGVSGAMANIDDPEKRIRMLLVHGMLHLVGYDHIEDDDYVEMVEREEELLKELGDLL